MRLADPAKVFVCFLARGEAVGHGESLNNRQERRAEEGKENGKEKKGMERRQDDSLPANGTRPH